jgi:hypothetical protein
MSLAQVVYKISTDNEFASDWARNPEAALKHEGLKLSREELEFLTMGLKRDEFAASKVGLSEIAMGGSWR